MYTRIALRALKVFYSDVGEGGDAVNCEKNTICNEHPVAHNHNLRIDDARTDRRTDKLLSYGGPFHPKCAQIVNAVLINL